MLGTIWAFAYRHRETEKNLCRGGRSQDLPSTDSSPASKVKTAMHTHSTELWASAIFNWCLPTANKSWRKFRHKVPEEWPQIQSAKEIALLYWTGFRLRCLKNSLEVSANLPSWNKILHHLAVNNLACKFQAFYEILCLIIIFKTVHFLLRPQPH